MKKLCVCVMALLSVLCVNAQEQNAEANVSKFRNDITVNSYVGGESTTISAVYSARWKMSRYFYLGGGAEIGISANEGTSPLGAFVSGKFLVPLRDTSSVIPFFGIDLGVLYNLHTTFYSPYRVGPKANFDFGVEIPTEKGSFIIGMGPAIDGCGIHVGIRAGYKF